MPRKLSVILFLFVILAHTFSGYVLKADYFLNISSYLEKCINKKKPQLKCNGQCQLAKKMNEANQNDEGNNAGSTEVFNVVLSSKSYPPHFSFEFKPVEISWVVMYADHIPTGYYPDIVHPPQLS